MLAANFSQFDDPNPSPGNLFGNVVVPLSTGNVVVTSPYDDYGGTDAGAVYLFNGATGALISLLRGSYVSDNVGSGGVVPVGNGNFVIVSPYWDNGGVVDVGAVTWGSGTTGVKGTISAANSLIGNLAEDTVGVTGVTPLTNGNYVVKSVYWDNGAAANAGAATWGSGTAGVKGTVSAANSLVGSTADDNVGGGGNENLDGAGGVTALTNGNYVVRSPYWDGATTDGLAPDLGAATWGSGTTGIKGSISATNSLMGSAAGDLVGIGGVTVLTNGNYVVSSYVWNNGAASDAGAATWGSGTAGVKGAVSAANSLVGSTAGDNVSFGGVTALTNGNYVVKSYYWDNAAVADAGAATWGSGTAGVKGIISAANSLVGSTTNDRVSGGSVTALPNGNYVVGSYTWDNVAAADAGAATWGSGTAGVKGIISAANSLVGGTTNDRVSGGSVTALTKGNYVVSSYFWENGAGAATWGSGTAGVKGTVSAANSLIGSAVGDNVSFGGVTALTNGNYVVNSWLWNNGAVAQVGASTWGNGAAGVKGTISVANSLIGSTIGDNVGLGATALTNGNYVVNSSDWGNNLVANGGAGAATWGNGTAGVKGVVSAANSLVGSTAGDQIGRGGIVPLTNGNYVVGSPFCDNGTAADAGAATWGSGTTGVQGTISAANSLVGSTAGDEVGGGGVVPLANGNYVVGTSVWDNGAAADAGAATWGSGTAGVTGESNGQNSALGAAANTSLGAVVVDPKNGTFFARFLSEAGGTVRVGSQYNGFLPTPNITNLGGNLSYKENAAAVLISSTATVTDVDSNHFQNGKLSVSFSSGGGADDRLAIRTVGTGSGQINVQGSQVRLGTIVLGTFTGGSGTTPLVVTFTNAATPSRVQTLLRNITYRNVSENPATVQRTVQVTVGDGQNPSAPVTKKISVVAVNDKPVLTLSGSLGYVRNAPAVVLAANATVTDVDSANFGGGVLRVRIAVGGGAANTLAIGSGFTVDASNNVKLNGTIIGKRISNGVGTNELKIQFNSNANKSIAQALVRAITYRNVGGSAGQRTIEFTVSDGDGGLSAVRTRTVNVT